MRGLQVDKSLVSSIHDLITGATAAAQDITVVALSTPIRLCIVGDTVVMIESKTSSCEDVIKQLLLNLFMKIVFLN